MLNPVITFTQEFQDIDTHWAKNEIKKWSKKEIIKGYNGNFNPNNEITRGEFAAIINRINGYEDISENKFTDLKETDWFYSDILKLFNVGVIKGFNSNVYPKKPISREEAVVMLNRSFNVDTPKKDLNFKDSVEISKWAIEAVEKLVNAGIITGYKDNKFRPKSNITRAEAIVLIDRLDGYIKDTEKEENLKEESPKEETYIITDKDSIISNKKIDSDLIVSQEVEMLVLNGVDIKGDLELKSDNIKLLYLKNVKIDGEINTTESNNSIEILVSEDTDINSINLKSSANIKNKNSRIKRLKIDGSDRKQNIKLTGNFGDIENHSINANIEINGKVDYFNAIAKAKLSGNFKIKKEKGNLIIEDMDSSSGGGGSSSGGGGSSSGGGGSSSGGGGSSSGGGGSSSGGGGSSSSDEEELPELSKEKIISDYIDYLLIISEDLWKPYQIEIDENDESINIDVVINSKKSFLSNTKLEEALEYRIEDLFKTLFFTSASGDKLIIYANGEALEISGYNDKTYESLDEIRKIYLGENGLQKILFTEDGVNKTVDLEIKTRHSSAKINNVNISISLDKPIPEFKIGETLETEDELIFKVEKIEYYGSEIDDEELNSYERSGFRVYFTFKNKSEKTYRLPKFKFNLTDDLYDEEINRLGYSHCIDHKSSFIYSGEEIKGYYDFMTVRDVTISSIESFIPGKDREDNIFLGVWRIDENLINDSNKDIEEENNDNNKDIEEENNDNNKDIEEENNDNNKDIEEQNVDGEYEMKTVKLREQ